MITIKKQKTMRTIYQPKGSAGEYALWACNMYVGCSNNCTYCYCKRGVMSHAMGGMVPTLKKGVGADEEEAFYNFSRDIDQHRDELRRDGGVFFTFTSDPLLPETKELNLNCIKWALFRGVAVKILTKCTAWADVKTIADLQPWQDTVIIGFTLTGHDEMEPGAATNAERMRLMEQLHRMGFHTWASIEPVVDLTSAVEMVKQTSAYCEHYKVGLMSGKRPYRPEDMPDWMRAVEIAAGQATVMWKRSVTDYLKRAHHETHT